MRFYHGILIRHRRKLEVGVLTVIALLWSPSSYGHVQEVIIQTFRASGYRHGGLQEQNLDEWNVTIAVARLNFNRMN